MILYLVPFFFVARISWTHVFFWGLHLYLSLLDCILQERFIYEAALWYWNFVVVVCSLLIFLFIFGVRYRGLGPAFGG
jgi:hypothetical protein